MIVMHGETLWSPALQPMDDDDDDDDDDDQHSNCVFCCCYCYILLVVVERQILHLSLYSTILYVRDVSEYDVVVSPPVIIL